MNKYVYSECPQEYFPVIKTIMAKSYNDAIERLINRYSDQLEDDNIANLNDLKSLREYLNEEYSIVLSDVEDIEEL